jgi:predicted nucleic acid-binding protein
MAVVSDTSPLRYLGVIGHADLIAHVFGQLVIPGPVLAELTHPSAPAAVRDWCEALPDWVSVAELREPPDTTLTRLLDAGEAAAIQLACELKATMLLIDERIGRIEATRRGIPVVGVLGVLQEGFRRGFISDPMAALAAMRADGFRVSKRLLDAFQTGLQ